VIPPVLFFLKGTLISYSVFETSLFLLGLALVQSLLAALGTFVLCGYYDLPNRQRLLWAIAAFFGGWGVCLGVVACYRRLVKEACSHCQKVTRVDLETCTHCDKAWLPPELDQIEIFDIVGEAA